MELQYLKAIFNCTLVLEVRVFFKSKKLHGFFGSPEAIISATKNLGKYEAIYTTINPSKKPVTDKLTSLLRNAGTSDKHITSHQWLPLDFDPDHPTNTNTTESELQNSIEARDRTYLALERLGWPEPISGMSGNGGHLLYPCDLPNTTDTKKLLTQAYKIMEVAFKHPGVIFDKTVRNPSRIWKLYGTVARKGPASDSRPHRTAVCTTPENIRGQVLTIPNIQQFCDDFAPILEAATKSKTKSKKKTKPKSKTTPASHTKRGDYATLDIVTYFQDHNLYLRPIEDGKHAVTCPWEKEHSSSSSESSTVIFEADEAGVWPQFHCSHAHCEDRKILDVIAKIGDADRFCSIEWEPPERPLSFEHMNDWGNAQRLIELYGEDIRYLNHIKKFVVWNGFIWRIDEDGAATRLAKSVTISLFEDAVSIEDEDFRKKALHFVSQTRNTSKIEAMLRSVISEPGVTVPQSIFNTNDDLFATTNGIVDLTLGTRIKPDRQHYITQQANTDYDPDATCPNWLKFLDEIFQDNKDLISFIQRAVGYSLTARTDDQCMFILNGDGSNGKTTFLNTLMQLFGDYGAQVAADSFMAKRGGRSATEASPDIARLHSVRLVCSSEGEESQQLDEALVKALTGSEPISARFLYGDIFEYTPKFKIWFATNHRPTIKGTDYAIWRRIHLIPFDRKFSTVEKDMKLPRRLLSELPGILNWAMRGYADWIKKGLNPPLCVSSATEEYRQELDLVQQWLDDCLNYHVLDLADGTKRVEATEDLLMAKTMYNCYDLWATENGIKYKLTLNKFGRKLKEKGFATKRQSKGNYYFGVTFKPGAPV